jgi:magnesium-transporting ATPase (P-type)
MSSRGTPRWHGLPHEDVARLVGVDLAAGLSEQEVRERLAENGPNALTPRPGTPVWKQMLEQFRQPLIVVLLVAAAVAALLGKTVDAFVIAAVVAVNALAGALQEHKAGRAIDALAKLMRSEVFVRRAGVRRRVSSEEIVPGDIVLLEAGDRVPADLRLASVRGLQIDESALTGESSPVAKNAEPLAGETLLPDRCNLAFAGTLVTAGRGEGIVWATGDRTETGRIARLVEGAASLPTPLTRRLAGFARLLLRVIAGLAIFAFAVGIWRGENPVDMFMAAVALAVGAIPEGLPAALSIVLAIGVGRMAARRAIIRRLPAVETLGSTTVICTDKTGTLTENAMTVRAIFAGGRNYLVKGVGYEPCGDLLEEGGRISPAEHSALAECLKAGLLCNDARLVRGDEGRWKAEGDPTDAALLVSARKAGLLEEELADAHPRIDAIPFASEHQFMATLHGGAGGRTIYKKGSVERILDRCENALDDAGTPGILDKVRVREAVERMAGQGLRVLAFARAEAEPGHERLEHEHVAGGLTFLGLQGMMDPPRPEAIHAVRRCRRAGISVKMITGDHLTTARAIASQMRLGEEDFQALSGRELEALSGEALADAAEAVTVFARISPEQKLRLVEALQSRGHVVAMTGDGVNDAPALRQADIGVAMGMAGSEVAKGAADMVLTDDNFASIESAVEEGRCVLDNLTKFLVWTLPTNGGEALTILVAITLGTALPILPVQLLWINMATACLLGIPLAFEAKERDIMERPPRDPKEPVLTLPLLLRTGFVSLLMLAGAFGLFVWENGRGVDAAGARTAVVNVIVCIEAFYLVSCRSLVRPARTLGFFSNRWVFAGIGAMALAQAAFTYVPWMNAVFHTAPIDAAAWTRILAIGGVVFLCVSLEKRLRSRAAKA